MNKKVAILSIVSEALVILSFVFSLLFFYFNQHSYSSFGFPAFCTLAMMALFIISIVGIFNNERKMMFIGCGIAQLVSIINFITIAISTTSYEIMLDTMTEVFLFGVIPGLILSGIATLTSIKKKEKYLFLNTCALISLLFIVGFTALSCCDFMCVATAPVAEGQTSIAYPAFYVCYIIIFALAIVSAVLTPVVACHYEKKD